MGIIKNFFNKNKEKTDAELKAEVLKKATEHLNATPESSASHEKVVEKNHPVFENIDQVKKKNIRAVLLEIAERGEAGVLATSISDKVHISKLDTSNALYYLTENKFAEAVNSPSGVKFYLTDAGRKYCLSKEFNSDF